MRKRESAGKYRFVRAVVLLLLVDITAALGYLLLVQASIPPLRGTIFRQVGVVFFADFGTEGLLGAESKDRVAQAARLFRDGRITHLICVGGRRENPERFGALRMANALVTQGVPREAVTTERSSFDTRSNWEAASRILQDRGWSETLLISSALHLYRIEHIADGPLEWTSAPTRTALAELKRRPLGTWLHVHREWLAWVAMWMLPDDRHRDLIRGWRNWWH